MLIRRATGRYKETKFYRVGKESDLRIVPFVSQGEHNLGRGKGQYFHRVSERGRKEIAVEAINSRSPGTSEETIPEGQAGDAKALEEDDRKAVFGKTERTV